MSDPRRSPCRKLVDGLLDAIALSLDQIATDEEAGAVVAVVAMDAD